MIFKRAWLIACFHGVVRLGRPRGPGPSPGEFVKFEPSNTVQIKLLKFLRRNQAVAVSVIFAEQDVVHPQLKLLHIRHQAFFVSVKQLYCQVFLTLKTRQMSTLFNIAQNRPGFFSMKAISRQNFSMWQPCGSKWCVILACFDI